MRELRAGSRPGLIGLLALFAGTAATAAAVPPEVGPTLRVLGDGVTLTWEALLQADGTGTALAFLELPIAPP